MATDTIPRVETKAHPLSVGDSMGRLFWWRGELFREIERGWGSAFDELWNSGLLERLQHAGLIPRVELTSYHTERGNRVLRHEVIPYVSYPCEWSFDMLRDAALVVLEINALAKEYGYELKDAHGHNVVFNGAQPMWVDLGSLIKRPTGACAWGAEDEFRRFYIYSLKVWGLSGPYVARRLLLGGRAIGNFEATRLISCVARVLPSALVRKVSRQLEKINSVRTVGDDVLLKKAGRSLGPVLKKTRQWVFPFGESREKKLRRQLIRMRPMGGRTEWSGYHKKLRDGTSTVRLERVVARVGALKPETVLDMGCNEGEFSVRFAKLPGIHRVIALDGDSQAVDYLYSRVKSEGVPINTVLSDAVRPLMPLAGLSQTERLQSDVVVALALTHHLLLAQNYDIDFVLGRLAAFSRGHLLVEFMPLGLWNGVEAPPVPEWYTREWFREALTRYCVDIEEEVLGENRILFQGEVRAAL